jgi:hypothetical protein
LAEHKTCIACGRSLPATPANFHKSKDGFHARCRRCRNKKERGARQRKRNKKLEEIEKGAVDLFIASARIGGANIPHSSELLEVMMTYFGGVSGFANAYLKQFYDAPSGGAFRTKMLDGVMRLIVNNTAMGGAKKPLELMTEEELEAEARRQIMEAAMAMRVNGEPVKLENKSGDVRDVQVVEEADQSGVREVHEIPADSDPLSADGGVPDDGPGMGLRGT